MPSLKAREWQRSEASIIRLPSSNTAKIILFKINHNFPLSTVREIFLYRVAAVALEGRVEAHHSTAPTATTSPWVSATNKVSMSTQSKAIPELMSITTIPTVRILERSRKLMSVLKAPAAPPTA